MKRLILVCTAVAAITAFGVSCKDKTALEKAQDAAKQAQADASKQTQGVKAPAAPAVPTAPAK